jgi:DNA-binding protein HU-beta
MTKAELIERIARSRNLPPNVSKKDISKILGVAFDELASYFARAKVTRSQSPRFTFPRFGTFTKKKRSARRGVNPRTLEPMQIDACHILDFKASRELRDTMNNPGAGGLRQKAEADVAGQGRSRPAKKKKGRRKKTGNSKSKSGGRNRRLTPRDEEAELDALIDDEDLFEEPNLPAAPLQRARTTRRRSGSRTRNTG